LDVQSLEDIDRFFATLPEEFKAIDVVVNNAGLALERASLWEYDMKDVCTMLDTNIKGLVAVTKKVVPGMIERKRGHVINVGRFENFTHYLKKRCNLLTSYYKIALPERRPISAAVCTAEARQRC
jgi:NADP-dependent 3-hydroxy acid dehydrogenase YdfG